MSPAPTRTAGGPVKLVTALVTPAGVGLRGNASRPQYASAPAARRRKSLRMCREVELIWFHASIGHGRQKIRVSARADKPSAGETSLMNYACDRKSRGTVGKSKEESSFAANNGSAIDRRRTPGAGFAGPASLRL